MKACLGDYHSGVITLVNSHISQKYKYSQTSQKNQLPGTPGRKKDTLTLKIHTYTHRQTLKHTPSHTIINTQDTSTHTLPQIKIYEYYEYQEGTAEKGT